MRRRVHTGPPRSPVRTAWGISTTSQRSKHTSSPLAVRPCASAIRASQVPGQGSLGDQTPPKAPANGAPASPSRRAREINRAWGKRKRMFGREQNGEQSATSPRFVGRSFRAFCVSGFRSPMDSTGVLQSDPIPSRSSDNIGVARSASAASRTGLRDAYLCADPLAACTRSGDHAFACPDAAKQRRACPNAAKQRSATGRSVQPLASSLQHQDSNRLRCRLEFALTACKQMTASISNRRKSATFSCPHICVHLEPVTGPLVQPPASGLQLQEPNRQLSGLESTLTPAISPRGPFLIANFASFAIRELRVTPHETIGSASRFSARADSPAQPLGAQPKPAFLTDTACQLESALSPCRINTRTISNRRWIRGLANRFGPQFCARLLHDQLTPLIGLPIVTALDEMGCLPRLETIFS